MKTLCEDGVERPGIPFTQYMMPNGRQITVVIERPPEVEAKAEKIIAAGLRFECEMLSDYRTVSLTIANDEEDVAIKLCVNGPDVPQAVDDLILNFTLPENA